MKGKLICLTAVFTVLMFLVTAIILYWRRSDDSGNVNAEQVVAVNEIQQLARLGELQKMSEKAEDLKEDIRSARFVSSDNSEIFIICGIGVLFMILAFGYIYVQILRPFEEMKEFARRISAGELDIPLNYRRINYFGAFTWAFDSMRREITRARSCEREAVENNKTVIAALSHDIRTPIASIRAYAEGLEANMDNSFEKREKYLKVIMKKCDEVSSLTNDLFIHSIADLDKLKICTEEIEICTVIENAASEIAAEQQDVRFRTPGFTAVVLADKKRLVQIMENLINNGRKYAGSNIEVFITRSEGSAEIHVRDYGPGIPDEDMPFIFDKFYRGRNCGEAQGSGLGLYIVKYAVERMNGKVLLHNHLNGLEVIISLPVK